MSIKKKYQCKHTLGEQQSFHHKETQAIFDKFSSHFPALKKVRYES